MLGKSGFSDVRGSLRGGPLSAPGLAARVPGGARIDPLPAARAAPKAPPHLGDKCCLWQGVDVHVRLMPASLARGDDDADAVRAHVG
jgi:hypothetical protein